MGICLRNVEYYMDMGYGSFFNLRSVIANLLDCDFGQNYRNLSRCYSKADFDKNDEIAQYIVDIKHLDEDIVDFLYQPDSNGKLSVKTCRKLYKLIKNYNDDIMYGYVHANHTFAYFKEMIHDCARKGRKLYWN